MTIRIGIDVGGTNTDAVVMDGVRVLATAKTSTTPDVTSGVTTALGAVLAGDVSPADIRGVMIGTTHFTNAVVEGKRLGKVAAVRVGLPATRALPPFVDWPDRLRDALGAHFFFCRGGNEYDGRQLSRIDLSDLREIGRQISGLGVDAVAISAVFSPINAEAELQTAEIIREHCPQVEICLSHEIGRIGLLERENAAIMNASLLGLARTITSSLVDAVRAASIDAPVFLSQNDGTLMSLETAARFPVLTFASGPTNSMRGAALLSGEPMCAVVDVGGTTSDIGIVKDGFPRESSLVAEVAGVRTNFRMPDVVSLGIGGGSLVRNGDGVTIGPESVGYRLLTSARVFGGETLTATDVAVAAGRISLGDPATVTDLSRRLVAETLEQIAQRVDDAIDRLRTSSDPIPVVAVGGGCVLLPESLETASVVLRPPHHAVANAVGAAIAQVGGEVDQVVALEGGKREDALAEATQAAADKAVVAGARPGSVRIVEVEETALAYMPRDATRIKVKAVGDLDL